MLKCSNCGEEIFDWSEQEKFAVEGQLAQQANRLNALAHELLRMTEPGTDQVTDQDWINLRKRAYDWMTQATPLATDSIDIVLGSVDKRDHLQP